MLALRTAAIRTVITTRAADRSTTTRRKDTKRAVVHLSRPHHRAGSSDTTHRRRSIKLTGDSSIIKKALITATGSMSQLSRWKEEPVKSSNVLALPVKTTTTASLSASESSVKKGAGLRHHLPLTLVAIGAQQRHPQPTTIIDVWSKEGMAIRPTAESSSRNVHLIGRLDSTPHQEGWTAADSLFSSRDAATPHQGLQSLNLKGTTTPLQSSSSSHLVVRCHHRFHL